MEVGPMDQALRRSVSLPVNRGRAEARIAATAPMPHEEWEWEGWREVGSCRNSDPNLFYPLGRGRAALEQTEEAKAICRTCPSREPCLQFALSFRQVLGIWGGTSAEERRQLARERREAVAS
jgi:WhiB family redox-sensing transcriptional regulator